jgi:hypothetical protein
MERGDVLVIRGEKYDVLTVSTEFDSIDDYSGAILGKHERIELHKHWESKLLYAYVLKMYSSGKILFSSVQFEKPTSDIFAALKISSVVKEESPAELSEKDIAYEY